MRDATTIIEGPSGASPGSGPSSDPQISGANSRSGHAWAPTATWDGLTTFALLATIAQQAKALLIVVVYS